MTCSRSHKASRRSPHRKGWPNTRSFALTQADSGNARLWQMPPYQGGALTGVPSGRTMCTPGLHGRPGNRLHIEKISGRNAMSRLPAAVVSFAFAIAPSIAFAEDLKL